MLRVKAQPRRNEKRSRSAGSCATPHSLPPPSWVAGAELCGGSRRGRHAPPNSPSAQRGRHPMPCSRSGASPVSRLRCAGNRAKRPRSLRSGSRSGVDVPAHVVESGTTTPTSPAMVRAAHARGSGLALQHTLPSAAAGRSERFAEDCASRGGSSASRRQTRCGFVRERVARAVLRRARARKERFERSGGFAGIATFERRDGSLRARGQREGRRP